MSDEERGTHLPRLYHEMEFVLSYELFPPKTERGDQALERHLKSLVPFQPQFITCTFGAGGTTREKTLSTLALVRRVCDLPLASHLTCVGASREDLHSYLGEAARAGVDSIVAIRGDAPKGEEEFSAAAEGFSYGNELVSFVHREFPQFGIAVGGYPETHPEAVNPESDIAYLKQKVDCGADVVITQLFYSNESFFRFREQCAVAGIEVPIVPGILPITNYQQVSRITGLCGAELPREVTERLEACGENLEDQFCVGTEFAISQVEELVASGIPGIHFYVLNQSRATSTVLEALGFPR